MIISKVTMDKVAIDEFVDEVAATTYSSIKVIDLLFIEVNRINSFTPKPKESTLKKKSYKTLN